MLRKLLSFGCAWQKHIQRHNYNTIAEPDIQYFKSILPSHNVITDPHAIEPHNICFTKAVIG